MSEKLGESDKTLEDWKKKYISDFKDLHDNFSDQIPEEMLDGSNPENYKYKVRGNWFFGVMTKLQNAALMKMLPEDFNKEWQNFFKSYEDRMAGTYKTVKTTKEEIDTVNRFLIKAQEIISSSL